MRRKKNILICSVCLSRNYNIKNNNNAYEKRLTLKKYCSQCNLHTIHQETQ